VKNGNAVATPEAERGNPTLQLPLFERVQQRRQNSCTARSNRVTQRDRAAVHIHFLWIDPELLENGHRLHRERFVQLEEVDIRELPSDLLRHTPHGFNGCHQHVLRGETARRLADDPRQRLYAELLGARGRHHHRCRGAVIDRRCVARGDRTVFLEGRFQRTKAFDSGIGADRLVAIDHDRVALLLGNGDGKHLRHEAAGARGIVRLAMTFVRVDVLL
jgi:hypothetical protein